MASNRCPLIITRGPQAEILLQSSPRRDAGGAGVPMYHQRDSLEPLRGVRSMAAATEQWIVNAPQGVEHPALGVLLPALVIELQAGFQP